MSHQPYLDQPAAARESEMPPLESLHAFLEGRIITKHDPLEILQFPGGYSNLTFLLRSGDREFVMRKPPAGANIRTAHDMGREYQVLSLLQPVYSRIPRPLLYCDDASVIGSPFYIMERVAGVILRNRVPKGMEIPAATWRGISEAAVDGLAELHALDINATGLSALGKPEGYVQRQVEGWVKRYVNAQTDPIPDMDAAAEWLQASRPADDAPSFIHNDFKYDNLVLDPADLTQILAVLDWEMATVGSPLMDLGTTLGYWAEPGDSDALKPFNLTWLGGNLTREQVVERYAAKRGMDVPDMLFYYVFGSFKIGVIVQQIYARYTKGMTQDPRFAGLIHVVRALGANAARAIHVKRISNFH